MPNQNPIVSLESEQAVLGAILLKPANILEIIEVIRPEDFYREAHRKIYEGFLKLVESDTPIDIVTISTYLKDKKQFEEVGGPLFLSGLSEHVGVASNIRYYAQEIHDKSTLRRIQNMALNILKDCQNGIGRNAGEVIETAKEKISEIFEGLQVKGGKNIAKQIREYTEVTEGIIEVTKLYKTLGLVTTGNKKSALMALGRMTKEGFLAKIKPGYYRVMEKDAIRLKLSEVRNMGGEIDMRYPFYLEQWFVTYPKTVIVVSGEPDAGKTAFLLNVARMNMHLAPIYYWTSEMGLPELYSRVENFEDFNERVWDERIKFHERSANFADMVSIYPNAIHIIDNLEMNDEFYRVGGLVDDIWRALDKGMVAIGLHKDKGKDYGLGGMASVKRARLWLDLKPKKGGGNIMEVGKFKNWRDKLTNIKNKTFEFSLVRGCRIQTWE